MEDFLATDSLYICTSAINLSICDANHHNGETGTLLYMTKQIRCSPGAYKRSTGARLRHSKLLAFDFRLLCK